MGGGDSESDARTPGGSGRASTKWLAIGAAVVVGAVLAWMALSLRAVKPVPVRCWIRAPVEAGTQMVLLDASGDKAAVVHIDVVTGDSILVAPGGNAFARSCARLFGWKNGCRVLLRAGGVAEDEDDGAWLRFVDAIERSRRRLQELETEPERRRRESEER